MDHPDRPFGDEDWYRLSAIYHLERNLDHLKRIPGDDIADEIREELYWSGLGYKLELRGIHEDNLGAIHLLSDSIFSLLKVKTLSLYNLLFRG